MKFHFLILRAWLRGLLKKYDTIKYPVPEGYHSVSWAPPLFSKDIKEMCPLGWIPWCFWFPKIYGCPRYRLSRIFIVKDEDEFDLKAEYENNPPTEF